MYTIKAFYKKRNKVKLITQICNTDSYDEAMKIFEEYLRKKKINEEDIMNYNVVKKIVCSRCDETLILNNSINTCRCGAVYNAFGDEITEN